MPLVLQSPTHVPAGVVAPLPVRHGDPVFVESWCGDTTRVTPDETMQMLARALRATNEYAASVTLDTALLVAACSEAQSVRLLETLVTVAADSVCSTQPLRMALRLLYRFDAMRRRTATADEMDAVAVRTVAHAILAGDKLEPPELPFGRRPVSVRKTAARLRAAAEDPQTADLTGVAAGVRVRQVARCVRAVLPSLSATALKSLLGNMVVVMSRHPRTATALATRALLLLRAPGDATDVLRRHESLVEPAPATTHVAFMLHSPSFRGTWDTLALDDNVVLCRRPNRRFTVLPFRWQRSHAAVLTAATVTGDLVIFRPACQTLLCFWARVHRRPPPRFATVPVTPITLHMLLEDPACEAWAQMHGFTGPDIAIAVIPQAADAEPLTVSRANRAAVVEALVVCAYLQCDPPPRLDNMLALGTWPLPTDATAQRYEGHRCQRPRLLNAADRHAHERWLGTWLVHHRGHVSAMVTRINKAMRADRADKQAYYADPKAAWTMALSA
jgi:hypothetical protein